MYKPKLKRIKGLGKEPISRKEGIGGAVPHLTREGVYSNVMINGAHCYMKFSSCHYFYQLLYLHLQCTVKLLWAETCSMGSPTELMVEFSSNLFSLMSHFCQYEFWQSFMLKYRYVLFCIIVMLLLF